MYSAHTEYLKPVSSVFCFFVELCVLIRHVHPARNCIFLVRSISFAKEFFLYLLCIAERSQDLVQLKALTMC